MTQDLYTKMSSSTINPTISPILSYDYARIRPGFMKPTTSSESATSNYALLDQVAALHWINKNIQAFHGDPGQVTVMGHDTGAVCVSLLATSAVSRVSGG